MCSCQSDDEHRLHRRRQPELARTHAASFTARDRHCRWMSSPVTSCVPTAPREPPCSPASARAGSPDELTIAAVLGRPLGILHGTGEQLVNLAYFQ